MRIPSAILFAASIALAACTAMPAFAEQESCAVNLAQAKQKAVDAGAAADKIAVIADVSFVKQYTIHLGLGIPSDSNPRAIIFVEFANNVVFVGLVEQDDCIRYSKPIPLPIHARALKNAKESV